MEGNAGVCGRKVGVRALEDGGGWGVGVMKGGGEGV